MTTELQIAFLAEGKLYIKRDGLALRQVESTFAQQIVDRVTQSAERHGWRNRHTPGSPFSGAMIWGGSAQMPEVRKVQITGLTRSRQPGSMLYALDTGAVGGLFSYDLKEDYENRLFHKNEFRANDLAHHPAKEVVALSMPMEDGSAAMAVMQPGGKGLQQITEGDAVDQAPSWVPDPQDAQRMILVYQSAGIARNAQGLAVALGPYAIQRLDIDRVALSTVLENPRCDYLVPRVRIEDGQEALYFIRRPYKAEGHGSYTPLQLIKDILLFPFRLIRAVFGFLNFFSVLFAGKPLTTAGGPNQQKLDTRFMMLHGKMIDAEKVLKAAAQGQPKSLVPDSWELVKRDSGGEESIIAKGVLSFDLAPDGRVIYTNGSEIFTLAPGSPPERLLAHRMIQQVMAHAGITSRDKHMAVRRARC